MLNVSLISKDLTPTLKKVLVKILTDYEIGIDDFKADVLIGYKEGGFNAWEYAEAHGKSWVAIDPSKTCTKELWGVHGLLIATQSNGAIKTSKHLVNCEMSDIGTHIRAFIGRIL